MLFITNNYKNYFTIFPFLPVEIISDIEKNLHCQKYVTLKGLKDSNSEKKFVVWRGRQIYILIYMRSHNKAIYLILKKKKIQCYGNHVI